MIPKLNLSWQMKLTAMAVVLLIGTAGWRVLQSGAEARERQTSLPLLIATPVARPKNLQAQVQPGDNAPALAMATITVTNINDGPAPGPVGSLRRAINDALAGDTINFNLPSEHDHADEWRTAYRQGADHQRPRSDRVDD